MTEVMMLKYSYLSKQYVIESNTILPLYKYMNDFYEYYGVPKEFTVYTPTSKYRVRFK